MRTRGLFALASLLTTAGIIASRVASRCHLSSFLAAKRLTVVDWAP
jgi:hypothetical protein